MSHERIKVVVRGAVQGVGFRPFVYRLATELGLNGSVINSLQGVLIEAEGPRAVLNQFLLRLKNEKPAASIIQSLDCSFLEANGCTAFEIGASQDQGQKSTFILPDMAPCADCLEEIFDPENRRHLYPFTNCTNCGPRFTIIAALPYDRPNTSMKRFRMCLECEQEYHDPLNRRFHSQPNACARCGPQLTLWHGLGEVMAEGHGALLQAAASIRDGQIVALKGVGGFQLIVDARNEAAVARLRQRKAREEKPLAVMYPTLECLRGDCLVDDCEARLLISAAAPIVVLRRSGKTSCVATSVAPQNPNLGAMLPVSPLHHLLMRELDFPIVATSGNLSSEPICIDENDALKRLRGIADIFLIHDRPILRQMDDSIARVILGREMVLRRARGYAPLPISSRQELPPILATGSHLKNTVALGKGHAIFLSQHVGDLETAEALSAFRQVAADLPRLYECAPAKVACDLHPEYLPTKYARSQAAPLLYVQHHYAHVLACMVENKLDGPVLGIAWDGTGLGLDGTIWGGEFLRVENFSASGMDKPPFERFAYLRQFQLPGGDLAIKQPRRAAMGLLWQIFNENVFQRENLLPLKQFSAPELNLMRRMLAGKFNAPLTSSAGRLFDAVAAIVGLRPISSFEGQAAMELEFAIRSGIEDSYPFELLKRDTWVIDWEPMILAILSELKKAVALGVIAAKFHNTLAEMMVITSKKADETKIVLSGGCFQNKYLLERTVLKLQQAGLQPYWHQHVPTNDGGIALGQVMAALREPTESSQNDLLVPQRVGMASCQIPTLQIS